LRISLFCACGLSGKGWAMDINNLYLWIGFGFIVLILLVLDLGVFHRKAHAVSAREAAVWTAVWISVALLFNLAVYFYLGPRPALEYLTGYLIEKSLSVDNLFVFVVLFTSFGVAPAYQHRVLFWGILGALIMRGVLIAAGAVLMERFFWIAYLFGAFLIFTGFKIGIKKETRPHAENNPLVRLARRFLPVAAECGDGRLFTKKEGKWLITPLFLVLVTVETTDLVFALDSIPAIFAVTTDAFIVFTSNIFAILGLRSLYFLLARAVDKFYYLQPALAVILVFVGAKMVVSHYFELPVAISLSVVIGVLLSGMAASWIREKSRRKQDVAEKTTVRQEVE
jgi:tellurite resistance protein TerC